MLLVRMGGETHVTIVSVMERSELIQSATSNYCVHAIVLSATSHILYEPCVADLLFGTLPESRRRSFRLRKFTPPCRYSLWSILCHQLIAIQLDTYLISSTSFLCLWCLAIPSCSTCEMFTMFANHPFSLYLRRAGTLWFPFPSRYFFCQTRYKTGCCPGFQYKYLASISTIIYVLWYHNYNNYPS